MLCHVVAGLRVCYTSLEFDDDFSESFVFSPHCTKRSSRLCPQVQGFTERFFVVVVVVFISKRIIIK